MSKRLITIDDLAKGALPSLEDDGSGYDYTPEEIEQIKAMVKEARDEIDADPSSLLSVDELRVKMRKTYERLLDQEAADRS